ncbi:MAG: hypothetical protein ACTSWW_00025 [Promethearchaeota archaeon]
MTHYLTKLLDTPNLNNPAKDAPDIHKHFTRYSKGRFDGPVIKFSRTKAKISVWCSYEYEDVALRLALDKYPGDEGEDILVTGSIISGTNFSPLVDKVGLDSHWNPVKSKTKTVNYTAVNKGATTVPKNQVIELAQLGVKWVSVLFSFTSPDKSVTLKTKIKPPRPSNKNPEDASAGAKLKFCVLKIPNTEETGQWLLNEVAQDFKDEIPSDWKSIIISNSYHITETQLPPDADKLSSRAKRLKTLRKGVLNRVCTINNKPENPLTNSLKFTG